MSYSIYEQTSVDEILTDVKEALLLNDTTLYDFELRRLIKKAYKSICSFDNTIEMIEELPIKNGVVKLPCNFIKFDRRGSLCFDKPNNLTPFNCNWFHIYYTGQAFFRNIGINDFWNKYFTSVQIVGTNLIFNSNISQKNLWIAYEGLRINSDNTPFMQKRAERPLMAFACWQWIRSHKHITGHTDSQMQDYKIEWSNGKSEVEAKSKMPDALTKKAITRLWNSWI